VSPVLGLHAAILICKDLEAQIRFYTDQLGFPLTNRGPDWAMLKCGSQVLGLFAHGHHPEGDLSLEGAPKGLSHFEFSASDEDARRIEQALGELKDADGNLFHFVRPKT